MTANSEFGETVSLGTSNAACADVALVAVIVVAVAEAFASVLVLCSAGSGPIDGFPSCPSVPVISTGCEVCSAGPPWVLEKDVWGSTPWWLVAAPCPTSVRPRP